MSMIKPHLRVIRNRLKLRVAELRTHLPREQARGIAVGMGFVVGCGRSGTTILGDILSRHPAIKYLFEPWHLWRVIERQTDVAHIFGATDAKMLMTAEMCTPGAQTRFHTLMLARTSPTKKFCIEKTAHNAMRIGYLEALSPGAKYIHILRDGVEVASSIARLAETNAYKLGFRRNYNQWWGEGDSKWHTLKRDAAAAGYFPEEVSLIDSHAQRAAYEWLVSIGEIEKYRALVGERLHELRYSDLLTAATKTLCQICDFLEVEPDQSWIRHATGLLHTDRRKEPPPLVLPPKMRAMFNQYQERFGFPKRALAG